VLVICGWNPDLLQNVFLEGHALMLIAWHISWSLLRASLSRSPDPSESINSLQVLEKSHARVFFDCSNLRDFCISSSGFMAVSFHLIGEKSETVFSRQRCASHGFFSADGDYSTLQTHGTALLGLQQFSRGEHSPGAA
jgi:hypothetical protein